MNTSVLGKAFLPIAIAILVIVGLIIFGIRANHTNNSNAGFTPGVGGGPGNISAPSMPLSSSSPSENPSNMPGDNSSSIPTTAPGVNMEISPTASPTPSPSSSPTASP